MRSMSFGLRSALVVSAVFAVSAAAVSAQRPEVQAQETFRSTVDLVTIQASVRDARGRRCRG